jgi:hypothetical protein
MKLRKNRVQELKRIAENAHKNVIREGLMDALESLEASDVQLIKESIASKMLEHLGLDSSSPTASAFAGFVNDLDLEDIRDMLTGDNQCLTATKDLANAVAEIVIDQAPKAMGLDDSSIFSVVVREAMSTSFIASLNESLSIVLCDTDFSGALESVPGIGGVLAGFMPK